MKQQISCWFRESHLHVLKQRQNGEQQTLKQLPGIEPEVYCVTLSLSLTLSPQVAEWSIVKVWKYNEDLVWRCVSQQEFKHIIIPSEREIYLQRFISNQHWDKTYVRSCGPNVLRKKRGRWRETENEWMIQQAKEFFFRVQKLINKIISTSPLV